jgi:hypothetical protein
MMHGYGGGGWSRGEGQPAIKKDKIILTCTKYEMTLLHSESKETHFKYGQQFAFDINKK